jgi:predicted O-linked N-acetylglucosamine transferase (SPINDLY family)
MNRSCVFLDTIGFSGFNTAMQAIDCALPIVTIEGKFMRGRLASGILKRMGMDELITRSEAEYIDLVIRIVKDTNYRDEVVKKITDKRDILYEDTQPIRALETFLLDKCRMTRCKP